MGISQFAGRDRGGRGGGRNGLWMGNPACEPLDWALCSVSDSHYTSSFPFCLLLRQRKDHLLRERTDSGSTRLSGDPQCMSESPTIRSGESCVSAVPVSRGRLLSSNRVPGFLGRSWHVAMSVSESDKTRRRNDGDTRYQFRSPGWVYCWIGTPGSNHVLPSWLAARSDTKIAVPTARFMQQHPWYPEAVFLAQSRGHCPGYRCWHAGSRCR